jgi:hypothetical protein
MKKYLTLILLIVTLNSYAQVDSTKVWEAREVWRSNPDNYSQGQQMPKWDLDRNMLPIVALFFGAYFITTFQKRSKSPNHYLK